jgi:anti-sigma B factor antagonist
LGYAPARVSEVGMQLAVHFAVQKKADVVVVRVQETRLTYPLLSPFFAAMSDVVAGGARKLVIDMQAVVYIDSSTMGCLVEIHRLAESHGGAMKLSGLQPRVDTMLSMAGVKKLMNVCRDEAEAVSAFAPDRARRSRRAERVTSAPRSVRRS